MDVHNTTITTIVREQEILFRQYEIEDSEDDEKDLRREDKDQITEIEVTSGLESFCKSTRYKNCNCINLYQKLNEYTVSSLKLNQKIKKEMIKDLPHRENWHQTKLRIIIRRELIKESEKGLGESFFNYDINDFKPDELNQIINCQQISESDMQSLHVNNKNSKEEINKLYEEFGIKMK